MIVLGVDAALNKTGWARVQDDEVLATGLVASPAKSSLSTKLWTLYDALGHEVNECRRASVDGALVVVERPGRWARGKAASSQNTVERLAMARAAVILAAQWVDMRIVEIDVNEARELVLGQTHSGRPGFDPGKSWVRDILKLRGVRIELIGNPDAADAAVVALAGYSLWRAGDPRFVT